MEVGRPAATGPRVSGGMAARSGSFRAGARPWWGGRWGALGADRGLPQPEKLLHTHASGNANWRPWSTGAPRRGPGRHVDRARG
jgi:hypothetical protein